MATGGAYQRNAPGGQVPPPPGQGHYASMPDASLSGDQIPRHRSSFSQSSFASSRYRPYAPSDLRPHDGNVITPYNEEKAYAEYTDAYGPPPRASEYSDSGSRAPPPASAYDYDHDYDRRYPADSRDRYWRGESEGPYYDDDRYTRGPPSVITDRTRAFDRRRPSRDSPPSSRWPWKKGGDRDVFGQGLGSGERGLASALLGGAAGAWIGHEAGHGALETLSGFAVGAIGGSAIEKQLDKYREKKRLESLNDRAVDDDYYSRSTSRPRRRTQSVRRDASADSFYSSYSMGTARPRDLSPDRRRRRDSRAASVDSKARRRYSGSTVSYIDDRR